MVVGLMRNSLCRSSVVGIIYAPNRYTAFRGTIMKLFIATLLLPICAPTFISSAQPRGQEAVAFVNVNVVPMDSERVLNDQTVVVRGDRFVQISPASNVKVPAGALCV